METQSMAERKSDNEVPAVKDEDGQRPIPTAWRPVFRQIVQALVAKDYRLSAGIAGVAQVSAETAKQIEGYIEDYGETLVELPEKTWESSVCIWMGQDWDVLIDLWTMGEGRSDMVLSARVSESISGYQFRVEMVYVP
jgi:hypothetical protein